MKKVIYKDGFDGKAKIVRTNDVDTFLKHNTNIKVIGISEM